MTEIELDQYLDEYVEKRQEDQSGSTVKQKKRVCEHLIDYIQGGDPDPDDPDEQSRVIDPEQPYTSLDTIRNFFTDTDLTISKPYLYHIRDFLEFISKRLASTRAQDQLLDIRDKITKDRWPDEVFETDGNDPVYLPDEDIKAACRHATTERAELVIRFLFWTGCRLGEMRAVTVDDIDFDTDVAGATVRISKQKTEDNDIVSPKSEAGNRTVELDEKTATMLQDYIDRKELSGDVELFPLSEDTYRQTDVKQAFTRAGIQINEETGKSVVTPHWLRHQRNTRLREQYRDTKVARYMGHKRSGDNSEGSDMTDHYTHYDPDEAQGLVGTG